ncbi:MAG: type II secretion system secretin GspD [Hyphomicrobium sp.]|nr:type II secretion system secretin GspD [Hyphomicrobium sp.]
MYLKSFGNVLWTASRAAGPARRLAGLALACALSACGLSSEQLSLPAPIGGGPPTTGTLPSPKGTALGDPASAGAEGPRIFEGHGKFLREPGEGSVDASGAAVNGGGGTTASGSIATGQVTGDGVTLDLVNATIPEAARTVLGDILKAPYVVADGLKGTVTLQTTKPVSADALLEIFETVLAANDAALVVEGGIYRVVTRDAALAAGRPVAPRPERQARGPGVGTEIVPLRYVSATEMERILGSVVPKGTIARVDKARNLLVVTGTRSELAAMADTVRTFDVDWMRGMSFGIFPLETSDPEAIAQELDTVFANDSNGPSAGLVRFVPNARLKAVLVITSRREYLKKAETWIRRLDLAAEATEKRAFVYRVQYRPVQELAEIVQKVYANPASEASESPVAAEADGATTPSADAAAAGGASEFGSLVAEAAQRPGMLSGGSGSTANVRTNAPIATPSADQPAAAPAPSADSTAAAAPAETAALPASGMLARREPDDRTSGISVVADEANNSLIISATPSEIRRIRKVLSEIDVMPTQVLLEATIAEVTLTDDLRFGLRWFFENRNNQFRLTDTLATNVVNAVAPQFAGFTYFLNTADARVALNALADITNVDVVSSPSLMVLNNKKAVLQIGDQVPIKTQEVQAVVGGDAPIINAITFRDTGILLTIIPRVSDDGSVLLEIEQEVSDVKATTSSTIDSPTIAQRRIRTTVSVNNGGSVVLAGLMQDRATRARQQVPLAGDVPVIGNLFKNKNDRITRTELVIAITPQVVSNHAETGMIAAEFRDRLNFTTRPQRETGPEHKETLDRILR